MSNFKQYNWVDVKDYAKSIFNDYEYELPLAEDIWNLVMFNTEVPQKCIAEGNYSLYEKGDILIWLLVVYDFIFDFKCALGQEQQYSEHDIGLCDIATYNSKNYYIILGLIISEKDEEDEEDIYKCLTEYMWIPSLELLNKKMSEQEVPVCEFYNIDDKVLNFYYSGKLGDTKNPHDSYGKFIPIAYLALENEIFRRRKILVDTIYKYFDADTIEILYFLSGYHFMKYYTDYEKKKTELITKRDEQIKALLKENQVHWSIDEKTGKPMRPVLDEELEIEEDCKDEINELEDKYPLVFYRLDEMLEDPDSGDYEELGPVYQWIENKME